MAKGLDSPTRIKDPVALKAAGYDFVIRYLFRQGTSRYKEPFSRGEAQANSDAGLYNVAIWEGDPIDGAYFTTEQGKDDAEAAELQGAAVGMSPPDPIYFAVDYDAGQDDANLYFYAVNDVFRPLGAAVGVYGNGAVCERLSALGLVHYRFLAGSKGWRGYEIERTRGANIEQGPETHVDGLDVDVDWTPGDAGGGWKI